MNTLTNEHLTHYLNEIIMHSYGLEISFEGLQKLINNQDTEQTRFVWFELNSFLSHAAMISKYICPISKKPIPKSRAEELTQILGITKNSKLMSRDTRDSVEHFDERIDNWTSLEANCILETVFQNRKAFNYINGNKKNIKRVLLKDEMIFITENRKSKQIELELTPIYLEVKKISKYAEHWLNTSSPYLSIYPIKHDK